MSSRPNFRQGRSPILDAFFLFRFSYSHRFLHSFTRLSAAFEGSPCRLTNPHTSALVMTSHTPSDPITINLSVFQSSSDWIQGSEISPIFFASRSPRVRVIAIPGPYSSAHTLGGPTCCPQWVSLQIFPSIFQILQRSSGLVGLWSQLSQIASFYLIVCLNITALESPRLATQTLPSWMQTVIAQVPELEQSIPEDFSFFQVLLKRLRIKNIRSSSDKSSISQFFSDIFQNQDWMWSFTV